jgi:hypothetical protein
VLLDNENGEVGVRIYTMDGPEYFDSVSVLKYSKDKR